MRTLLVVMVALVVWLATGAAHAEAPPQGDTAAAEETFEPVAVPEPSAQAMQYYRSGNVLWIVENLLALAIPAALVWFGFSAAIRRWVARAVKDHWYPTVAGYWIALTLLLWVLNLPLEYYTGFVRPHAYGLSDQSLSKWFGDSLTLLALGAFFGSLLVWIPFAIIKRSPNRWWIYTSLVAIPLTFAALFLVPVFISPLFNDFGPLADKALEAKILAMAERAGIEGGRVFEVKKSVDTNQVNAYVTGLGSTKRIVLWDTLLARLNQRQILVVMGHEMGHYVLGHVQRSMLLSIVVIPASLGLIHVTAKRFIARFHERIGFDSMSDVAALPLLLLLGSLFGFIAAPIFNAISRDHEHESDRFALEMTRDNHACATAFVILQQSNLGNPRPGLLYKLWRSSHPPLGERIDFCNSYHPWTTGEPLQYEELFDRR
jgi:Zn-dependent protease with chaperone function